MAHILVPYKTMHYHLLHTILGLIWLVKVHIFGFFFYHLQAKSRAFIHFALYDVVDMFFLPLIQCFSADVQNGHHKKSCFCHKL